MPQKGSGEPQHPRTKDNAPGPASSTRETLNLNFTGVVLDANLPLRAAGQISAPSLCTTSSLHNQPSNIWVVKWPDKAGEGLGDESVFWMAPSSTKPGDDPEQLQPPSSPGWEGSVCGERGVRIQLSQDAPGVVLEI